VGLGGTEVAVGGGTVAVATAVGTGAAVAGGRNGAQAARSRKKKIGEMRMDFYLFSNFTRPKIAVTVEP
jgi:hypothetical protein